MLAERPVLILVAWLFTYAIHSTVLIGGAWLAACGLAKAACSSPRLRDRLPSLRDRLWKVALVGGIATATLQVGLGFAPWGAPFALARSVAQSTAHVQSVTISEVAALDHAVVAQHTPESPQPNGAHDAGLREAVSALLPRVLPKHESTANPVIPAVSRDEAPRISRWAFALLAAWAVGVAIGLGRWLSQWNHLLRRLDDRQTIVSGTLYEVYQHVRLRSKARSTTRLCAAPGLSAPITLGITTHEICVPPRVDELHRDEIGALLAHELAHAERRDPLWVAIGRLIEVVLFFQPLNKLCSTWLQDEAEYLADDWAVVQLGERVPLASCLTEIAGWIVLEPHAQLASGMAAPGTRLAFRVRRMLDEDHDPAASTAGGRARGITALATASVVGVALWVPGVSAQASVSRSESHGLIDSGLESRTRELEREFEPRIATDISVATSRSGADEATAPNSAQVPAAETTLDSAQETDVDLGNDDEADSEAASDAVPESDADSSSSTDHDSAASPEPDADLGTVLNDLEQELDRLRSALRERDPSPELSKQIAGLQSGLDRLRSKHTLLQMLLEARVGNAKSPVHTNTSPSFFFTKD